MQHVCSYACSEEVPEPVNMGGSGFSVAFDPLDGSSIVDTNFAVGTIFGVWPGDKLVGVTGREQAAAGMGVFGPRTVYVIAIKGYPGTFEFLLQDDGKWLCVKETTEIGEIGKEERIGLGGTLGGDGLVETEIICLYRGIIIIIMGNPLSV